MYLSSITWFRELYSVRDLRRIFAAYLFVFNNIFAEKINKEIKHLTQIQIACA
jgi:hypothetical protein